MKNFILLLFISIFFNNSFAQNITLSSSSPKVSSEDVKGNESFSYPRAHRKEKYNVAVLTPLFLDSVNLTNNISKIPRFMMPGIDFYQGIMIAADSLRNAGHHLDIYIFDSKSNYLNVQNLIESDKLDNMDLIIGNASVEDLKILAEFAKRKEINFVSAVSPSEADQEFNPYFTILQPRLVTHVEAIHKVINKKYSEDNVVFVYRKTSSEENALGYFKNDKINNLPGRFSEYLLKGDDIDIATLKNLIESNYNTSIVLGILNPKIAYNNLKILLPYAKKMGLKIYGMPTTEMINSLKEVDEFPALPIYYSSAAIIDKNTPGSRYVQKKYYQKMGTDISDIAYKGFESLFYFSHLMQQYGVPFNEKIDNGTYSFITPYKIMPVKNAGVFKFFENKYLYIVKHENGVMTFE